MAHDSSDEKPSPLVTPPAAGGGRWLLLSGVAVACSLGAGLGLWARPALEERPVIAAPPPMPPVPRRELRIVVDAPPLPAGEVAVPAPPSPVRIAENAQPVRPVMPLVRLQAPPAPVARAVAPAIPPIIPTRAVETHRTPPPAPPRLVKAVAPPAASPPKPIRKADHVQAPKPRPDRKILAKAPMAPAKPKLQLAKTQPHAKPAKASPAPLARLIKTAHAPSHAPKVMPKLEKVRLVRSAKADARKAKPLKPQKVAAITPKAVPRKPAHLAQAAHPTRPTAVAPSRPAGLMKVANTSRCASADPGAAIVCANPSLGAADRQMNRAYQDAKAAGVPEWRLQRQQQRWLAARTAAAREAPWAVHDVYQARIAELNGMAREAQTPSN
jgi:uncharacterized protein YecT (DUF1311 family)